jgi:phosphatidylglycerol:prolipoprotein diacylglycerol transferase
LYPTLFRIGTFEITTFGVLVALGALAGLWLFRRELTRRGLPDAAETAALAGIIGGLVGAKLLWTIEHLGEEPVAGLLFSRGGMSWFGGFLGGVGTGLVVLLRQRAPIAAVIAAATPALAIGHAIGRVGCFMVGDDYGRPSDLPWAVAFPLGLPPTDVPVHPTQIYEAVALLPIAWLLIRLRRRGVGDVAVLGFYLVSTGVLRFAIEFVRVNTRVLGPFTVAHLVSLGLVLAGIVMLVRAARSSRI